MNNPMYTVTSTARLPTATINKTLRNTYMLLGMLFVFGLGLEPPLGRIGGSADLGVVQWNRRQVDASAVQVEVPAVDPEFAEAKPLREGSVQHVDVVLLAAAACGRILRSRAQ